MRKQRAQKGLFQSSAVSRRAGLPAPDLARLTIEYASDAIFWMDFEGRFLYTNAKASRVLGYEPDELLEMSAFDIDTRLDPELWQHVLERVESAGSLTEETGHRTKDGRVLPVEATCYALEHEGTSYACVIARDISRRKQAEADLRLSEVRYRTLAGLSPVGIFHSDPAGNCLWVNRRWAEIAGLDEEEAKGMGWVKALHPEDRDGVFESWQKATLENQMFQGEYRFLHADGSSRWVVGQAIEQRHEGEVIGFVGTVTDITELKAARDKSEAEQRALEEERRQLEAQVQHRQKLESLGVLAGGIAHDFNNLLGGILGNAELAMHRLERGDDTLPLLRQISRAAERSAELSNQMLAYSGKGQFVIQSIDLEDLVSEMASFLKRSISKKARLQLDFCERMPRIEGDATQIRQVVMNLITNASDALENGNGVITLSTGVRELGPEEERYDNEGRVLPPGRYAELEVRDDGCGMDSETRQRIFEPFFTTKRTGRGLGMAAVLGIVRGHRGAIEVESSPGAGAIFRLLIPVSESALSSSAVATSPKVEGTPRGGTVLVADDEEIVRLLARSILEDAGFEVLECADGRSAVELFEQHRESIVVVLLDLSMPVLGGLEAFAELRRSAPEVKVIFSSGYSEKIALADLGGDGAVAFVKKPYRPGNLLTKLDEVLTTTAELS